MGSFASNSSVKRRRLPYLAACLLTSTTLACASDDADIETVQGEKSAEQTTDETNTPSAEPVGPEASPEAQAARDEAANPGSAAVTRYDGDWTGTTSQDKPVSFKVLNRFLAHAEVSYALEGCTTEGEVKLSAMTPTRMGGFTLMTTTDAAKLVISGKFTGDDSAEGDFTIDVVGDAPEGCSASVSGTWTASK